MAITEKYVSSLAGGGGDGTIGTPFTWAEMVADISAGSKAGNRYNVKADGAYARTTTTDTLSAGGTSTSPVIIRGYSSTIADGNQGRANGNGALITTNMPVITYTTGGLVGAAFVIMESLNVASARSGNTLTVAADGVAWNCAVSNSSTNGSATAIASTANRALVIGCDAILTAVSGGSSAVVLTGTSEILFCRIRGGPAPGITIGGGARAVIGNVIFRSSVGIAITSTGAHTPIYGNSIVNNTGDGIDVVTGTTVTQPIFGNLITDNGGFGIDGVSAANAVIAAYNRLDRNTGGNINSATDWIAATSYGHNTASVTKAQEYVDADNDDYRLQSTSPAKGAGWFSYLDIGALQRHESASGGSPNLNGGITQ